MLLFFTLIIAICGIFYELLIGTLSSYLIGDSIRQFSFTIGFFMSGMGIGAYLSRFLEKNAIRNFLKIELILSIIGASSAIILKMSYIYLNLNPVSFQFIYFLLTMTIGSFVGIEIPLVAAIYKQLKIKTKSVISDIFTFDYIGGLVASILFPIILIPYLGLYNISIFVGSLNLLVAIMYIRYLKTKGVNLYKYFIAVFFIIIYFLILIFSSNKLENFYMKFYYKEPVLESYQTDYQNIVLTKRGEDFRMYLNGNIQFLSLDENRYHEALVDWPLKTHPLIPSLVGRGNNIDFSVLILGGGDGLAARNLLKYDFINKITLVELDPKVIEIAQNQRDMVKLNQNSLNNPKIEIINMDATKFIENTKEKYDFIIADFPDPRDVHTSKLYSKEFYIGINGTLKHNGIFVTQSSSSFFATKSFWSIRKTIDNVFGNSIPYHRYLPSFGDWGFVVAIKNDKFKINENISQSGIKNIEFENILCPGLGCTGFDQEYMSGYSDIKINTISNPVIIDYYIEGYKKFNL